MLKSFSTIKITVAVITVILISFVSVNAQETADAGVKNLLLRNFRPVSINRVPVTKVLKAKYPVIDMHSHAYASTPADVEQWVKNMDAVGVEKTVILTMAAGKEFDSIAALYGRYPDRFLLYCELDYEGYDKPNWAEHAIKELERCYKKGARGVGELADKGFGLMYGKVKAEGMHFDDKRMDPIFAKCAELNIPVSFHLAEPKWMYEKMDSTNDGLMNAFTWRLDNKPCIVNHEGMMKILENAVRKNPKTIFIANHYINLEYDFGQLGNLLDKYPNLYVDNSARYAEAATTPRAAKSFYEKYADRIFFGTDMGYDLSMYKIVFRMLQTADEHFYETELFGYHWALSAFDLSSKTLKKVYHDNAVKILKKTAQEFLKK